jgi:hypothetical protein
MRPEGRAKHPNLKKQESMMIATTQEVAQVIGRASSLACANQHSRRGTYNLEHQGSAILTGANKADRLLRKNYAMHADQTPREDVRPAQRFQIMSYMAGIFTAMCAAVAAT